MTAELQPLARALEEGREAAIPALFLLALGAVQAGARPPGGQWREAGWMRRLRRRLDAPAPGGPDSAGASS